MNFGTELGLVITRRTGESLAIVNRDSGESMIVTAAESKGSRARIAINAGDTYEVIRAELAHRVPNLYEAIRVGTPITPEMMIAYELLRGENH
jgi:sRNA-binding carbon storage regulator CsrA